MAKLIGEVTVEITYDADADALYVRLTDGIVARSVELDHGTVADLNEHGDVLGVEVLRPSRPRDWQIFNAQLGLEPEILALVEKAQATVDVPAGQRLASCG